MRSKAKRFASPPSLAEMRSRFEKQVAEYLFDHGIVYEYEKYQFPYTEPLRKNKAKCVDCGSTNLVREGWYTPDFYIPSRNIFIETKGRFTAADRRKMLSVIQDNPDDTFKMLFMRDNRIHKRSKTTYTEWCAANGVDCAVQEPKKEWL